MRTVLLGMVLLTGCAPLAAVQGYQMIESQRAIDRGDQEQIDYRDCFRSTYDGAAFNACLAEKAKGRS